MTNYETSLSSAYDTLSKAVGGQFANIVGARNKTEEALTSLEELGKYCAEDSSIVLYGSLGRHEYTDHSDVDWALVIDGKSRPEYFETIRSVDAFLKDEGYKKPGRTGVFGDLVSSHDIVNYIGGTEDSNSNLTRRILLLLESAAAAKDPSQKVAYDRTIRAILNRYIVLDAGWHPEQDDKPKIPRFLLNDIARYWRTIAVDYAAKKFARGGEGWALRNIKLRFSRKLMYVSGLLMCLNVNLHKDKLGEFGVGRPGPVEHIAQRFIAMQVSYTPLDIVSKALIDIGDGELSNGLLRCYDEFLGIMSDKGKRDLLEDMPESGEWEKVYRSARDVAHDFQSYLRVMFFGDGKPRNAFHENLIGLAQRYGMF